MSKVLSHYARLAYSYDDLYAFEKCYEKEMIEAVVQDLSLTVNDQILDVGGGTGYFAEKLYKTLKLKYPVVCLEPSIDMASRAAERTGVVSVPDNLKNGIIEKEIQFNKMLLKASVHHIDNREQVWKDLYGYFPINSQGLIIATDRTKKLPFTESILQRMTSTHPDLSPEIFVTELKSAGFEVENPNTRLFNVTVTKTQWYSMLRGRFLSSLRSLTDEEIESSIQELDQKYKNCEKLEFLDTVIFIKFAKRS